MCSVSTYSAERPMLLWYVSYGSNLSAARFGCYLYGGRPTGARRTYPGCRDRSAPRRTEPAWLPGGVYFATESPTWTGGVAFLDATIADAVAARRYLVTPGQFADVVAQEMRRPPQADLDLTELLDTGRQRLGGGRYETLVRVGEHAGFPMVTFTAPWSLSDVDTRAPSAAYLRMIGLGLMETHGWDPLRTADYLCARPGAAGHWSVDEVSSLLSS
ncbi:histone deacetylase [Fodinicola feengrottensis]